MTYLSRSKTDQDASFFKRPTTSATHQKAITMQSMKNSVCLAGEPDLQKTNQSPHQDNLFEELDDKDDGNEEEFVTPILSAVPANTFEFQGKTYTRYQDFVDAKRAFNEVVLNSVGVVEAAQRLKSKKTRPVTPETKRGKKRPSVNSNTTPRKSPRLEKQKSASRGGETKERDSAVIKEIDESDSEDDAARPVARRLAYRDSRVVERVCLSEDDDEPWVKGMQEWLEPLVSMQNCRNVIRQVRLLSSGVGVDYKYWPEGVSFYKGAKVDLTYDLDGLLDEAYEFENIHGKDRGNGWLLLHPIKKMSLYKKYLAEKS